MTLRPSLFDDTLDLLDALDEAGAQFIVVGAHALAAHGILRATGDFDLLVNATADNARRVIRALETFGAPLAAHGVREEDFARPGAVYQLGLPPRRIDLLTRISGVGFDEAWATRLEVVTDGRRLPILGREALLQNKRASGRPKDLLDVLALEGQG